jgi:hypothetical protein
MICRLENGSVIFRSRNGVDFTSKFPQLVVTLSRLKVKSGARILNQRTALLVPAETVTARSPD